MLNAKPDDYKQTEFDSSVETLRRIADIIRYTHLCAMGETDGNNIFKYINCLDRLFIESSVKMDKKEKERALSFQEGLGLLENKWGSELYRKYVGTGYTKIKNSKYVQGWNEMRQWAREYELFLMESMDRHNMLMKNQQDGMTRFRGGK